MLIAGIDDAGRGAIIGPLIIAGVLFREEDLHILEDLKVKDSKLLSPSRRERFADEIKKAALKFHIVEFEPERIDDVVNRGRRLHRLNWLEAYGMAEVIINLKPDIAIVDASDVIAERFKDQILGMVPFNVKVISEHKADRKYPVVSAASIIAKVERDRRIAELRRRYGELGSGYASDRRTMKFLERWVIENKALPDFVRRSWKPAKKMMKNVKSAQMKIQ